MIPFGKGQMAISIIPTVQFGFVSNVQRDGGGVSCDYFSLHDSGLYSNVTTALHDVLVLHHAGITVRKIDFSAGMTFFKDDIGKDVYPLFFEASRERGTALPADLTFNAYDVHKVYKRLPLQALSKAADVLFKPSPTVFNVAQEIVKAAGVEPTRTIAICYRGTNKGKEVSLAPIDHYIAVVENIGKVTGIYFDILIQTDQAQARQAIMDRFGPRVRFFKDLPVTTGSTPIHKLEFGTEVTLTREDFAIRMMAAVVVMSQCAFVVTHSGNIGAWIAILRGSTQNLYQFDATAQLQTP
jgi:hypothetical protein